MATEDRSGADYERRAREQEARNRAMDEELRTLRRHAEESPRRVQVLEQRLQEARNQLAQAAGQNEKLTATLREARDQISQLREEVEKLTQPPNGFGLFLRANEDGTADVFTSGRKMRVGIHPTIEVKELERGEELVLNEALNVVETRGFDLTGEVVTLKELLGDGRAVVVARHDEERVVEFAESLDPDVTPVRAGDSLLFDQRAGLLLEKLARPEVEELVLEEVPDISYADVGGLNDQIEQIQDAVELPYIHHDLFAEHQLKPPKGILLYGPPGCGKTLIAKAVANSLARKVAELTGNENARSYFLNIKGPELLNKYVGETERQIRLIFQRAKEKSQEGVPVIVFFDEMDSLFRMRGSGISSDVESTIVPQLLSEIDGVETLKNVIVIGASNREDLIDPAILRPGRLDVKIKINRPDREAARDVFLKYLKPDLPIAKDIVVAYGDAVTAVETMVDEAADRMYEVGDDTRFLEVTYAGGDKEVLYFKDFASGAMIENIVARAKKTAIKRHLLGDDKGIRTQDLVQAVFQEFKEHEDLPNTTNPDDWAKISGKKGERIVYVRTLIANDRDSVEGGRSIDTVNTGQYL
ncbi:MAG: proteasome ATPase [Actinobacteria bacterium ATB1]|nr:proteasome ATPase [Actinobacteria bacterium ATB1]